MTTDKLLTTAEVAGILGVSERTVQRMVDDGDLIPTDKIKPRGWLFDPLAMRKTKGPRRRRREKRGRGS